MSERLRITGGTRRGRRLFSPPANTIRPASDFLRQAVFNMLGDTVEDCTFFDVFAGTGIVGLEALSRGAARVIFVERDRRQMALIKRNLAHAKFGPEAQFRTGDAYVWANHFFPTDERSIVFLGPPYEMFKDNLPATLAMVESVQQRLRPGDTLVLQASRYLYPDQFPDPDHWYRMRLYGKTRIGIWRPGSSDQTSPDEEAEPVDGESSNEGEDADDE